MVLEGHLFVNADYARPLKGTCSLLFCKFAHGSNF